MTRKGNSLATRPTLTPIMTSNMVMENVTTAVADVTRAAAVAVHVTVAIINIVVTDVTAAQLNN